ncbi:PilZ domain-containing protein [Allorhizobium borbori]|uniref:PilZ domain-containing protein n=1 Tax=Allorhizobium borbori TaxID=485907 RepID=A0A7W6JZL9_9HYPH|nr:PilZ domain-containing protein [Allorhizobium borbori]MBB4102468.1 hypothetical protein [Allorhizobium borbori]
MLTHTSARAVFAKRPDIKEAFHRVSVNLPGRMMLADRTEHDCSAVDMSPGDAVITAPRLPKIGERVIAYIDHIGRLEGTALSLPDRNSFIMSIVATERKREKLAAQLTWIANRHELGLPEDRRHDRLTPRRTLTEITIEDGRKIACRLIDLSLSGAAVDMDGRLPIGTPVRLGSLRARVVRHFADGIAVEFSAVQTRESLAEFL